MDEVIFQNKHQIYMGLLFVVFLGFFLLFRFNQMRFSKGCFVSRIFYFFPVFLIDFLKKSGVFTEE